MSMAKLFNSFREPGRMLRILILFGNINEAMGIGEASHGSWSCYADKPASQLVNVARYSFLKMENLRLLVEQQKASYLFKTTSKEFFPKS